jgi:NAD(P)-dependent dehydrogenase (short-subunit alcohol dehydrogenase family)
MIDLGGKVAIVTGGNGGIGLGMGRGIAAFLASSASDFVTGTAIPVDGGYSVQA